MMLMKCVCIAALAAVAWASAKQYRIPEGDKLELNMGTHVRTWSRSLSSVNVRQTTRYCHPAERKVQKACGRWVDEDGRLGAGEVEVRSDGTLVIPKIALGDQGDYASPDELVRASQLNDGVFVATPRSLVHIKVIPLSKLQ